MVTEVVIYIQENVETANVSVQEYSETVEISVVEGSNGKNGTNGTNGSNGLNGDTASVNLIVPVNGNITLKTDNIPEATANYKYVTDAEKVILSNTSGTNTGDNTANTTSNTYADSLITGLSAAATGTVDVITATYSPAPTLVDRKILFLRTLGTNTITTPTFNPNGLGALTIVKQGGVALAVGDLKGNVILMYNLATTQWELINPLVPTVSGTNTGDNSANTSSVAHSLATAANDFIVASGVGVFIKKTLAEVKTILGLGGAAYLGVGTTAGTVAAGDDSRFTQNCKNWNYSTPASHTGNTNETVLASIAIDANSIIANDFLQHYLFAKAVGLNGLKTIRVYLNTTNNLTGSPVLLYTYYTNNLAYSIFRHQFVESSSLIKSYYLYLTNGALDQGSSNAGVGSFAVNLTVTNYLICSVQLANAIDVFTLEGFRISRSR